MFGQYFGNYLVEKNKISQSEFEDVMKKHQDSRVKLGLIAVAEKLLTTKQAEEVNELQKRMDIRFGDIAIDKGYLLNEEVTYLLNMQGNPYLKFVQALTESNIMTIEEIEANLNEYKQHNNLSNSDIDAIKSGDIDRIINVFVDIDLPFSGECLRLAIRNIIRFIHNNIMVNHAYKTQEYNFGNMACQTMTGDQAIFVGFASKDKELLKVAEPFAKEHFPVMDEDAFDSVCEFINCTNGLYASKLSTEDVHIDMNPPLYFTNKKLTSKSDIYVVPVIIEGEQIDLIVAVTDQVEID